MAGGAKGGRHKTSVGSHPGTFHGGRGAVKYGWFSLTGGAVLNVVVGQKGGDSVQISTGDSTQLTAESLGKSIASNAGTGGGGGSFVYSTDNVLYLAAGGGGGAAAGVDGVDGQSSTASTSDGGSNRQTNSGVSNGNAAGCCYTGNYHGGIGAGWNGKAQSTRQGTYHGEEGGSRIQNFIGGRAGDRNSGYNGGPPPGAAGGFGGGGGGAQNSGGSGGGGGYSGGGSGKFANHAGGGGSSYCAGSYCTGIHGGNNADDGFVHIKRLTNTFPTYYFDNHGKTSKNGLIQSWTVPDTGLYVVRAGGARGGTHMTNYGTYPGTYYGGKGALTTGRFNLVKGSLLQILCGHRGGDSVERKGGAADTDPPKVDGISVEDNAGTGGGGRTFVYNSANTLYLAAGGGGGATAGWDGIDGQGGTSGTKSVGASASQEGTGGTGGNAGSCCSSGGYHGGVGAGWNSEGTERQGTSHGEKGSTRVNGWKGGRSGSMNGGDNGGSSPGAVGGFGGGGGGSEDNGASGAGGGYSGGGSGKGPNQAGGGGGSYCNGYSCLKFTGGNPFPYGFFIATFIGPSTYYFDTLGRYERSGVIQSWTVPETGTYFIKAGGAPGGNHKTNYGDYPGDFIGGRGAIKQGLFSLIKGTALNIVVGQKGGNSVEVKGGEQTTVRAEVLSKSREDNAGSGGGGGTFIYTTASILLLAAGGGGGATAGWDGQHGHDGESGSASIGKNPAQSGNGGSGGNPGECCNTGSYHGGVGAGWLSQGPTRASSSDGERGGSRMQGWVGGQAGAMNDGSHGGPSPGAVGGFGGGGGGAEDNGASGGGGGYSGGGSGTSYNQAGGGGGAYCAGEQCSGMTGGNFDIMGYVWIEKK